MKKLLLLMMALVSLVACKETYYNPIASGRPYEVLVVMDKDMWNRPSGRALFAALDTDVPGLPQSEPSFHISQCNVKDMDATLSLFRNIIRVNIDKTQYTHTKMKFTRNAYAKEQIILTFQSPSEDEFEAYCREHKQDIVDFICRTEINRLIVNLHIKHSDVVTQLARELFNCDFYAPDELESSKRGQDFFWASNNSAGSMVNVCVYSYPYEGPETFNKQYVLAKRDSVMKKNIPGSEPNMFMKTDTLYTDVKPIWVHKAYAMEARGLWYMENDAMGGPFISHSRVDTINRRVVVAEGFVFAPEKMKRGLLRRLEGALYTLSLPQEHLEEVETGVAEESAQELEKDKL